MDFVVTTITKRETVVLPFSPQRMYSVTACAVMLLERGIRNISQVLVLARNSVYSARSVEDAIPHVYKMGGHRSFRENPLILSS